MGRIFRVVPGKTPCFHCIALASQENQIMKFPYNEDVWTIAPYEQGLPGVGIDVSDIAVSTARLVLQTIFEESEDNSRYPKAETDHYILVIHETEDLKPGIYPQRVKKNSECPYCEKLDFKDVELKKVEEIIKNLEKDSSDNEESI